MVVQRASATGETKISSLLCLLRAEALESMDVRSSALIWYKKALELDVTCVEAWKRLNEGLMLSPSEESTFLASLKFTPEQEWLKAIYVSNTSNFVANHKLDTQATATKSTNQILGGSSHPQANSSLTSHSQPTKVLPTPIPFSTATAVAAPGSIDSKKVDSSSSSSSSSSSFFPDSPYDLVKKLDTIYKLGSNEDVVASRAHAAFYSNQIRDSFNLTSSILARDPYCTTILATHLSCLVELGMKNELYLLAHKMAENAPKSALSWYAVGCYYFLIRSWQNARLYFGKATSLKREFGAAWLAYGYTFAQNGDLDQALSAYRTAARLLVGSHLPTLLIAVELSRAKDMVMAKQFAQKSVSMQPLDPYPLHELGVIMFRNKEYNLALEKFNAVIDLVGRRNIDITWEPTIYNLGLVHIRLGDFDTAITLFDWSLSLLPHNTTTYSSLAFTHHMLGNLSRAIEFYHQVLSLSPEDDFALDGLDSALSEWAMTQHVYREHGVGEEDQNETQEGS
jgi:tetratricopeptide (TPR) repeat protein